MISPKLHAKNTHGSLELIEYRISIRYYKNGSTTRYIDWYCKCICGKFKYVPEARILSGSVKSCGCQHNKKSKFYVGMKIHKLTLLERFSKKEQKSQRYYWKCLCDCGQECIHSQISLYHTKSCGCYRKDSGNLRRENNSYFDLSKSHVQSMKDKAKERGLEFNVSIEYLWDLFITQDKKCSLSKVDISLIKNTLGLKRTASLDRIDSTKGYIEGNVQWVHKDINTMKWDLTQEEFIQYCKLIASNN